MELEWVPSACTLPTVEQPLRVAEFDDLFAKAVRVERPADGELAFAFPASPELAGAAATLAARETACCSFFTFTRTVSAEELTLAVSVAEPHIEVLTALAARVGS
ncbi:hypothetical protein [Actinophytocola glycyrrhizae]|uniref:Arsenate reductase n=1 Tax=Actinophytocola glycyrrhizae TaxID=2044873 RepID=A0ABV9S744_9PSEU